MISINEKLDSLSVYYDSYVKVFDVRLLTVFCFLKLMNRNISNVGKPTLFHRQNLLKKTSGKEKC